MLTALAYLLVIPLSSLVMTIGVFLAGFPIALVLAWTSVGVRTKLAGFLGGIAGVGAAIAFGYFIFRWLVGPASYTLWPFLASSVPLGIPIARDLALAKRVKESRDQMLKALNETPPDTEAANTDWSKTAHSSMALGEVFGIILALSWFFGR